MKLNELYAILNDFAPKALSDEYCATYDGYDNRGILIDCNQAVQKVLFSLDFSLSALEKAKEMGANVLITHHPAIYAKIGNVRYDDLQGKKLQFAIQNKISVISMHLNYDCAEKGIDYWLMQGIGGTVGEIQEPLSKLGHGYGRIYDIPPVSLQNLVNNIQKTFSTSRTWSYGAGEVCRVASFCGAGATESAVLQAVKGGADCIVSADYKHHVVAMALEYGLKVIQMTHYASEAYGFKQIYENLKERLGVKSEYFTDAELL